MNNRRKNEQSRFMRREAAVDDGCEDEFSRAPRADEATNEDSAAGHSKHPKRSGPSFAHQTAKPSATIRDGLERWRNPGRRDTPDSPFSSFSDRSFSFDEPRSSVSSLGEPGAKQDFLSQKSIRFENPAKTSPLTSSEISAQHPSPWLPKSSYSLPRNVSGQISSRSRPPVDAKSFRCFNRSDSSESPRNRVDPHRSCESASSFGGEQRWVGRKLSDASSSGAEKPGTVQKGAASVRTLRKLFEGGSPLPPPSPEKWSPHVSRRKTLLHMSRKCASVEALRTDDGLMSKSQQLSPLLPRGTEKPLLRHRSLEVVPRAESGSSAEVASLVTARPVEGRSATVELQHGSSPFDATRQTILAKTSKTDDQLQQKQLEQQQAKQDQGQQPQQHQYGQQQSQQQQQFQPRLQHQQLHEKQQIQQQNQQYKQHQEQQHQHCQNQQKQQQQPRVQQTPEYRQQQQFQGHHQQYHRPQHQQPLQSHVFPSPTPKRSEVRTERPAKAQENLISTVIRPAGQASSTFPRTIGQLQRLASSDNIRPVSTTRTPVKTISRSEEDLSRQPRGQPQRIPLPETQSKASNPLLTKSTSCSRSSPQTTTANTNPAKTTEKKWTGSGPSSQTPRIQTKTVLKVPGMKSDIAPKQTFASSSYHEPKPFSRLSCETKKDSSVAFAKNSSSDMRRTILPRTTNSVVQPTVAESAVAQPASKTHAAKKESHAVNANVRPGCAMLPPNKFTTTFKLDTTPTTAVSSSEVQHPPLPLYNDVRAHGVSSIPAMTSTHSLLTSSIPEMTSSHCTCTSSAAEMTSSHCLFTSSAPAMTSSHCLLTSPVPEMTSSHCLLTSSASAITSSHCNLTSSIFVPTSAKAEVEVVTSSFTSTTILNLVKVADAKEYRNSTACLAANPTASTEDVVNTERRNASITPALVRSSASVDSVFSSKDSMSTRVARRSTSEFEELHGTEAASCVVGRTVLVQKPQFRTLPVTITAMAKRDLKDLKVSLRTSAETGSVSAEALDDRGNLTADRKSNPVTDSAEKYIPDMPPTVNDVITAVASSLPPSFDAQMHSVPSLDSQVCAVSTSEPHRRLVPSFDSHTHLLTHLTASSDIQLHTDASIDSKLHFVNSETSVCLVPSADTHLQNDPTSNSQTFAVNSSDSHLRFDRLPDTQLNFAPSAITHLHPLSSADSQLHPLSSVDAHPHPVTSSDIKTLDNESNAHKFDSTFQERPSEERSRCEPVAKEPASKNGDARAMQADDGAIEAQPKPDDYSESSDSSDSGDSFWRSKMLPLPKHSAIRRDRLRRLRKRVSSSPSSGSSSEDGDKYLDYSRRRHLAPKPASASSAP